MIIDGVKDIKLVGNNIILENGIDDLSINCTDPDEAVDCLGDIFCCIVYKEIGLDKNSVLAAKVLPMVKRVNFATGTSNLLLQIMNANEENDKESIRDIIHHIGMTEFKDVINSYRVKRVKVEKVKETEAKPIVFNDIIIEGGYFKLIYEKDINKPAEVVYKIKLHAAIDDEFKLVFDELVRVSDRVFRGLVLNDIVIENSSLFGITVNGFVNAIKRGEDYSYMAYKFFELVLKRNLPDPELWNAMPKTVLKCKLR